MKTLTFFLLAFALAVFAEEDFDKAKSEFHDSPSSDTEEVSWLEPYDETYLPYGVCSEVYDFSVAKLEEKVKYYYDHKPNYYSDHYYALFSIVRVTYVVTCKNKLRYKGVKHLFSKRKLLEDDFGLSDSRRDEFKAHAHGWREKSLNCLDSDGVFFDSDSSFRFEGYSKFHQDSLVESWKKQKVAYPEWKYTGVPGKKLARPVLFVHGLNSDFEVWGVEALDSTKNKASTSFQWGLVKRYENGSAPDILARTQNIDNSEENINHNGIYFFQAYGHDSSGTWIEGTPLWNDNHSQAKKLNWKLEQVLDDFCEGTGIDWRATPELEVDIVAHSQGGLVVRELLRALQNMGDLSGSEVAANHIGKLWFRVPEGKELYVPVDDWYTPVSKPSLENVGEDVWALKFGFDRCVLYPGKSVTEGNVGLHLADWSAFDKTVCGMALLDSTGDVIYGKEPSVPECRSYETSQPLTGFARREKR